MKPRFFGHGILISATAALGLVFSAEAAEPAASPNILLIITDQQHSGMMSCTGNKWLNTPALDGLAREGIRFENAYAANPVCVPSRISMATGVMPGRFGVFSNAMRAIIPHEVDQNSLGKLIKRAGYDTFYGGKVHMCSELSPRNAGYDEYHRGARDDLPDACIEFIQRKRRKPFFAVASFINPHDICYAYRAHKGQGGGKGDVGHLYRQASSLPLDQLPPLPENYEIQHGEPEALQRRLSPRAVTPAITMRKDYNEREWRIYRWIYCRLTEQVDGHIGRILDAVKEAGLEQQTLIIFTSDHGNMDASHRLASKGLFYRESVKVPFLMKYKGVIPAGKVDTEHLVAAGLDILPTLGDYAGSSRPTHLQGMSLRPVVEGKQVTHWRPFVVSENGWSRMIRSERFKYCVYIDGAPRESLVDLKNDPGEMKNLASEPEYKDVLVVHRRYLRNWVEMSNDVKGKSFVLDTHHRP